MLKDLARALSLANLCFIAAWVGLLDTTYNIPGFNQHLAIIINVALLTLLIWIAVTLARRSGKLLPWQVARLVFPVVLLLPLNELMRRLLLDQKPAADLITILLAIAIISLSDVNPWSHGITQSAAKITLVLFPFALITMGQAVWLLTKFSDQPRAPAANTRKRSVPRVLWLIFDEMDYQIAFSKRPSTLSLPELDLFRSQALFASNAYPPADRTGLSIPALITGKTVSAVDVVNPSRIMLTFSGSEEAVNWDTQPHVFSKAREAGLNSAVIGWYFPYCRVIGESLTSCCWQDIEGGSLRQSLLTQGESLIDTVPFGSALTLRSGMRQTIERNKALEAHKGILENAKKAAANPYLDLVFIHWSVPHPPGIYNRHEDHFELNENRSYLDNLHLVDRTLTEMRRVLEEARLWEESIILVTSDHSLRTEYWRPTYMWTREDEETLPADSNRRVPFLLKLPGQKQGVHYDLEFNTILTHDLLLALLSGELSGPDSVVEWLNGHR